MPMSGLQWGFSIIKSDTLEFWKKQFQHFTPHLHFNWHAELQIMTKEV